jgi:UPF0716 family protein affecting phage T7 exclusion
MIYFLIYLFIEIVVSYQFTTLFTPLGMFLEVLITALLGVVIIRNFGFSMMENMQKVIRREIDQEEFLSIGLFKLVGALLLIVPGVFTDILGILMQFDQFGALFAKHFLPKEDIVSDFAKRDDDEIIDVEIIEKR